MIALSPSPSSMPPGSSIGACVQASACLDLGSLFQKAADAAVRALSTLDDEGDCIDFSKHDTAAADAIPLEDLRTGPSWTRACPPTGSLLFDAAFSSTHAKPPAESPSESNSCSSGWVQRPSQVENAHGFAVHDRDLAQTGKPTVGELNSAPSNGHVHGSLLSTASSFRPSGEKHKLTQDTHGIEKRRSKDRSKAKKSAKLNALGATGNLLKRQRVAEKYRKQGIPVHTGMGSIRGTSPTSKRDGAAGAGGLPVTPNAFIGCLQKEKPSDRAPLDKDAAIALGLRYVPWNGRDVMPLLDNDGVIFAVCAGTPKDEEWSGVMAEAQKVLEEAQGKLYGDGGVELKHRRGRFAVFASGISYGGGQTEPTNISYSGDKIKETVRDDLLSNPSIQRIAGFGDSVFRVYAPRLHAYYSETLTALLQRHTNLHRNFKNSAFASMTFNLGPHTVTYVHTDHQNLPAGWCAVTALGDYNPTLGGHIILWDAQLIIEFPPGATILIPSALIRHSNTTIQPHEARYSLTQYSAGGLFRWVECGFRSQKRFEAAGCEFARSGRERWLSGVDMFSTWSEFCPASA